MNLQMLLGIWSALNTYIKITNTVSPVGTIITRMLYEYSIMVRIFWTNYGHFSSVKILTFHECSYLITNVWKAKSGQKEHFLILINDFLILINGFLIFINDFLISINHFLILINGMMY